LDGSFGARERWQQEEYHQRPDRRELSQGRIHKFVLSVKRRFGFGDRAAIGYVSESGLPGGWQGQQQGVSDRMR
jgi:hypothetical protein